MKRVRYTKFIGDLASEIDIEDLLKALSDYLLDSGFHDPYPRFQDHGPHARRSCARPCAERSNRAICSTTKYAQQLEQMAQQGKLDELIDKLIERMEQENYISYIAEHEPDADLADDGPGRQRPGRSPLRSHRQEPRLPRLQNAARSARLARQIELRPPRHAPLGHRHRGQRRLAALRVRRHAQPRRHHDAQLCHLPAKASACRSTSNTTTCTCTSASTRAPAPPSSCSTARTR